MDLKSRVRRRQRSGDDSRLVVDYDAISPVFHLEEPIGRGPVLERLLDYVEPVFDGDLPPNAYLHGPGGSGKSAVVTALFSELATLLSPSRSVIHTATRARSSRAPSFVYVDARGASSEFGLYHAVLDGIVDEPVPRQGIGVASIRDRLDEALQPFGRSALLAVDHVGEPDTLTLAGLAETLEPVDGSLGWLAIGREPLEDADALPPERIAVPAYEPHALVDIVTERASTGLAQRAVEHEETRRLARWAEGDAHDALSALFGGADRAVGAGRERIHTEDLSAGMNAVPRPSVSLGRVLALSANRQLVLRVLVDLPEADRASVTDATAAIADADAVDLSETTVKRFLYELAEAGIVERVTQSSASDGIGRPPSRVEPRFPTTVFARLYDLQNGEDQAA